MDKITIFPIENRMFFVWNCPIKSFSTVEKYTCLSRLFIENKLKKNKKKERRKINRKKDTSSQSIFRGEASPRMLVRL